MEAACEDIERPGVWTEMRGLNIYRTSYKDKKTTSVKKNLVYQMIYQGFMIVAPFLTVPYLAEVFGPGNIGQVSFVNNIVNYFVMFVALGAGTYGNREIAYIRNANEKGKEPKTKKYQSYSLSGRQILQMTGERFKHFSPDI